MAVIPISPPKIAPGSSNGKGPILDLYGNITNTPTPSPTLQILQKQAARNALFPRALEPYRALVNSSGEALNRHEVGIDLCTVCGGEGFTPIIPYPSAQVEWKRVEYMEDPLDFGEEPIRPNSKYCRTCCGGGEPAFPINEMKTK